MARERGHAQVLTSRDLLGQVLVQAWGQLAEVGRRELADALEVAVAADGAASPRGVER